MLVVLLIMAGVFAVLAGVGLRSQGRSFIALGISLVSVGTGAHLGQSGLIYLSSLLFVVGGLSAVVFFRQPDWAAARKSVQLTIVLVATSLIAVGGVQLFDAGVNVALATVGVGLLAAVLLGVLLQAIRMASGGSKRA